MPRGSIGRRVARAAATGGSRAYRGRAPVGWYVMLAIISVIGLSIIGYSRYEVHHPVAVTSTTTSTIGPNQTSHWYAALTMDVCGKTSTLPVSTNPKQSGIISLGSGIINIAPGSVPNFQDFSGDLATLGQFILYYKPKTILTSTELQLPGKNQKLWKNGDLCGTRPGYVTIEAWKTTTAPFGQSYSDPNHVKFSNGQMITAAFLPKGVPVPPASQGLQTQLELYVQASETSTTTTIPTTLPTSSTTSGSTSSTTRSGSTSSTTAGHGSSSTSSTAPKS